MACNYEIILKTGEVISFPSLLDSNEFKFEDLRNSLAKLGLGEVESLLNKIKYSKNLPLQPSSLNLKNVIKTSSLGGIMINNSKVFVKNEISAELLQNSKSLIKKLKDSGENINTHNVIYTETYDLFDANYGNVYDIDSNTFIINSSPKGEINFIALNKALIDIYILKHSSTIKEAITAEGLEVKDFIENMPFLYRKGKIKKELVNTIKQELNLSDDLFNYIYNNHSDLVKMTQVYEGKTKDDMQMFAQQVYFANRDFLPNKDVYYNDPQYIETSPILQVGDLIKVQTELKQGRFGVYLDEYTKIVNDVPVKHYAVLLVNNDGKGFNWKVFAENELKFKNPASQNNEFVIRKKLDEVIEDIDLSEVDNKPHVTVEPFKISAEDNKRIPAELLRLLKKGDKLVMNYRKKEGVDVFESVWKEVVGVKGNTIYLKQIVKRKAVVAAYPIGKLFATQIILDLENHGDIKNFDAQEFRAKRQADKTLFYEIPVNDSNREGVLKELQPGDIVGTPQTNNSSAAYFNYYFGDLDEKTALIAFNRTEGNDKIVKALAIPKSSIIRVIHNVENKKHIIDKYNKAANIIEESFKINVFNNYNKTDSTKHDNLLGLSDVAENNTRYSFYNVQNDTKTARTLKINIKSGDFVEVKNNHYVVLENNNGILKLYNSNELTKDSIDNVTKIVKSEPEITLYTEKTIQMNTPLVGIQNHVEMMYGSDKYDSNTKKGMIEMKYVVDKNINYEWDNDIVKQARFVDIDYYNSRKENFIDLSEEYTTRNLKEGAKLYGYKVGSNVLNNVKGTTSFQVRNLDKNKLFNMLTVGSYLRFENTFKTFRIEEKTEEGFVLSYSNLDKNGNVVSVFEYKPKEFLEDSNYANSVFNLFIPNVQTNAIDSFKNFRETVNKKIENKVTEADKRELLFEMSNYLSEKLNVPVVIGSLIDFQSDENLLPVKKLDSAKAFLFKGNIYINSDFASLSDPLHESLHLILATLKVLNPELYENMLVHLKQYEEDYNKIKENYTYLTHYEILEEMFVDRFAKQIINKLDDKVFNEMNLLDSINDSIVEILQLESTNPDTNEMLNSSMESLINEFGSNFINNIESLFDINASSLGNKITNAKRELIKNDKLKEECQ